MSKVTDEKRRAIQKYWEVRGITPEDYFGKHMAIQDDIFFVISANQIVSYLKEQFAQNFNDMTISFVNLAEITNKTLEDVENFFLPDILLNNGKVYHNKFINGDSIKSFIDGWMTEDEFIERFSKFCVAIGDFSDCLSNDYVVADNMYIFNLDV